jgi:signal transduction histidine kinase
MRDQLLKQYESLEDEVRKKTAELHAKMEELEVALSRVEEEKMNTQNALQVKEEALSTQERLMHSVAHDLKTPLNGILAPIESCNIRPSVTDGRVGKSNIQRRTKIGIERCVHVGGTSETVDGGPYQIRRRRPIRTTEFSSIYPWSSPHSSAI